MAMEGQSTVTASKPTLKAFRDTCLGDWTRDEHLLALLLATDPGELRELYQHVSETENEELLSEVIEQHELQHLGLENSPESLVNG